MRCEKCHGAMRETTLFKRPHRLVCDECKIEVTHPDKPGYVPPPKQ